MNLRYYDREGNPIKSFLEWITLFETTDRIVKQESIGPYTVSTIWMGLNHNFELEGKPLIFETMIFAPKGDELEGYVRRYGTEEEAIIGHTHAVNLCDHANGSGTPGGGK